MTFDVIVNSTEDDVIAWRSLNKKGWGHGADALSWYLGSNSSTFRINGYELMGNTTRLQPNLAPQVGIKYTISCEISETNATYSIDGVPYAAVTYSAGTVPSEGYFGFDNSWSSGSIHVSNVQMLSCNECSIDTDCVGDLICDTMSSCSYCSQPYFNAASTMTSYVDQGSCGLRGDDANADFSQCSYGYRQILHKPWDHNHDIIDGCAYYTWTVYKCNFAVSVPFAMFSNSPEYVIKITNLDAFLYCFSQPKLLHLLQL